MIELEKLDFAKLNGLIPAIITDADSGNVLMLGFMNKEALEKTIMTKKVTFFSRTKNRLWTKGETSGNCLTLVNIKTDCDNDTLLINANPAGPTCHTGSYSCFGDQENFRSHFLYDLYDLIQSRKSEMPSGSYTTSLFERGENRIIQKVGEEAVETVIAAKNNDKEEIINETSDLLYHLLVMLAERNISLSEVVSNLKSRHK